MRAEFWFHLFRKVFTERRLTFWRNLFSVGKYLYMDHEVDEFTLERHECHLHFIYILNDSIIL